MEPPPHGHQLKMGPPGPWPKGEVMGDLVLFAALKIRQRAIELVEALKCLLFYLDGPPHFWQIP